MSKPRYIAEKCDHCGQTTTYLLGIDRGTAHIVQQLARAIDKKGINVIHVHKELLAQGYLTANQRSNIARPRAHGLIAKVTGDTMRGNYALTRKGADFLRGVRVSKYAIMSKSDGMQIGYFEAEKYTVTLKELMRGGEYWEGINYHIEEGRVVRDPQVRENQPSLI